MSKFEASVARVLTESKPGDVLTYGEVASEAGFPGAARAVGNFLRTAGEDLPWWRVVNSKGRLHPHGAVEQAQLLAKEAISCKNGHIEAWK